MKSSIIKRVSLGILLMLLVSFIQMPVLAYTEDNICLNSADGEYVIYVKKVQSEEFEFAFSEKSDEQESNLEFISSEKDSSKKSLNVAYISATAFDKYFKSDKNAYIYVKNSKGEMVVSGDKVNLDECVTPEVVDYVSNTTKRIETKVDAETLVDTTEPIADTELSLNTIRVADYIEIVPNEGSTYEYALVKVEEGTKQAELFALAEEMGAGKEEMYDALVAAYDFNELLKSVQPSAWSKVEDNKIQQPIESETGDKYLVFIKETDEDGSIVDTKFMVCAEHDEVKYKDDKDKTISTIVKLPVTGETLAAVIALAIVVVGIVVVLFVRKKSDKESK